jgi:hypothetical protein
MQVIVPCLLSICSVLLIDLSIAAPTGCCFKFGKHESPVLSPEASAYHAATSPSRVANPSSAPQTHMGMSREGESSLIKSLALTNDIPKEEIFKKILQQDGYPSNHLNKDVADYLQVKS